MGLHSYVDRARCDAPSSTFAYLLTVAFVAAALAITLGVREFSSVYPTFFAFYAAVVASAWYGGYGPGWLSVVLSTLVVNYFFLPPLYSLTPSSADLPRLIAFIVCAIVANAASARQKRAENALRLARDGLEQTVKKRTAERAARETGECRWIGGNADDDHSQRNPPPRLPAPPSSLPSGGLPGRDLVTSTNTGFAMHDGEGRQIGW